MSTRKLPAIALVHYSAPPVIGGVENVILAHIRSFLEEGYPVAVVAGRGETDALEPGAELIQMPELDSQHPQILEMSRDLEQGFIPASFENMVAHITQRLAVTLNSFDVVIVHNVLTKHFNLALTAALFRLLEAGLLPQCVAWCHDMSWTSPHSRSKLHPGYPWDLLRAYRPGLTYVAVSRERQRQLADLLGCPAKRIRVIYNGVDPRELLALSDPGLDLINRLGLWDSDLNLILPVRVTQAKNIEFALRVAADLKQRGIRLRLIVTGPPDPHDQMNMQYFDSLLALREQLGITEQMRFVYESGPNPTEPYAVDMPIVAELLRVSDALFMPSHREGFGMPVLEAGLAGIPVFCSENIPAGEEIGGHDVVRFSADSEPQQVAEVILKWAEKSPILRLRRQVRQKLTWRSIFRREILPLLERGPI